MNFQSFGVNTSTPILEKECFSNFFINVCRQLVKEGIYPCVKSLEIRIIESQETKKCVFTLLYPSLSIPSEIISTLEPSLDSILNTPHFFKERIGFDVGHLESETEVCMTYLLKNPEGGDDETKVNNCSYRLLSHTFIDSVLQKCIFGISRNSFQIHFEYQNDQHPLENLIWTFPEPNEMEIHPLVRMKSISIFYTTNHRLALYKLQNRKICGYASHHQYNFRRNGKPRALSKPIDAWILDEDGFIQETVGLDMPIFWLDSNILFCIPHSNDIPVEYCIEDLQKFSDLYKQPMVTLNRSHHLDSIFETCDKQRHFPFDYEKFPYRILETINSKIQYMTSNDELTEVIVWIIETLSPQLSVIHCATLIVTVLHQMHFHQTSTTQNHLFDEGKGVHDDSLKYDGTQQVNSDRTNFEAWIWIDVRGNNILFFEEEEYQLKLQQDELENICTFVSFDLWLHESVNSLEDVPEHLSPVHIGKNTPDKALRFLCLLRMWKNVCEVFLQFGNKIMSNENQTSTVIEKFRVGVFYSTTTHNKEGNHLYLHRIDRNTNTHLFLLNPLICDSERPDAPKLSFSLSKMENVHKREQLLRSLSIQAASLISEFYCPLNTIGMFSNLMHMYDTRNIQTVLLDTYGNTVQRLALYIRHVYRIVSKSNLDTLTKVKLLTSDTLFENFERIKHLSISSSCCPLLKTCSPNEYGGFVDIYGNVILQVAPEKFNKNLTNVKCCCALKRKCKSVSSSASKKYNTNSRKRKRHNQKQLYTHEEDPVGCPSPNPVEQKAAAEFFTPRETQSCFPLTDFPSEYSMLLDHQDTNLEYFTSTSYHTDKDLEELLFGSSDEDESMDAPSIITEPDVIQQAASYAAYVASSSINS